MLGRNKRLVGDLHFLFDLGVAALLLWGVFWFLGVHNGLLERLLRAVTGYPFHIQDVLHIRDYGWLFSLMLLTLFLGLHLAGYYRNRPFQSAGRAAVQGTKGVLAGLGMTVIFFYFFSIADINRSLIFGFFGGFGAYLLLKESLGSRWAASGLGGRAPLRALWVGPLSEARRSARGPARPGGLEVAGLIVTGAEDRPEGDEERRLYRGTAADLRSVLAQGEFDLILLGRFPEGDPVSAETLRAAEEAGLEAWHFPEWEKDASASRLLVDEFSGRPVLVFRRDADREQRLFAKRAFDLTAAIFLLIAFAPVFLLAAGAVRCDSRGPIIYRQLRTGWKGKPFWMYKFRTMRPGADGDLQDLQALNEMKGPVFKLAGDPRVTRVGRWLRRFSLDELPQLWNVLRGEMSLVGPRPLPVYETENIAELRDRRRYSVPPGLTGLWQISGRSDVQDFAEWVRLDLQYIDRWNLWLDLAILCRTVPAVLSGNGAK